MTGDCDKLKKLFFVRILFFFTSIVWSSDSFWIKFYHYKDVVFEEDRNAEGSTAKMKENLVGRVWKRSRNVIDGSVDVVKGSLNEQLVCCTDQNEDPKLHEQQRCLAKLNKVGSISTMQGKRMKKVVGLVKVQEQTGKFIEASGTWSYCVDKISRLDDHEQKIIGIKWKGRNKGTYEGSRAD